MTSATSAFSTSGSPSSAFRLRKLASLLEGYDNVSAAADAWGVPQSTLSKILNRRRPLTARSINKIIAAEQLPDDWFDDLQVEPRETPVEADSFRFDVNRPDEMLAQLEEWFARLPSTGPTRDKVVKAVMRTLLDEAFSEVHPPTDAWRFVMNRLDGLTRRRPDDRRSSSTQGP